ncbi:TetR family transcriptional regulator [Kribbella sp. NPDC056861]|uniref:TetR family transcriptional regulator n=1 Tax=Kribbella sp. NPDC056861 TaxID=3154857 RepID=UPI003412FC73
MAWDVEGTKRRIHAAALAEFSQFGAAGTSIDKIAKRAGVNRERVYNYYGDKAVLFSKVIRDELDKLAENVPLRQVDGPDDLARFAGAAFDYQQDHPEVARLLLWEGLADTGTVQDEGERAALYLDKARAVAAAQRAGLVNSSIESAHLVFLLIALASQWWATPQMARMLAAELGDDSPARRRAAVVQAARRIAACEG